MQARSRWNDSKIILQSLTKERGFGKNNFLVSTFNARCHLEATFEKKCAILNANLSAGYNKGNFSLSKILIHIEQGIWRLKALSLSLKFQLCLFWLFSTMSLFTIVSFSSFAKCFERRRISCCLLLIKFCHYYYFNSILIPLLTSNDLT